MVLIRRALLLVLLAGCDRPSAPTVAPDPRPCRLYVRDSLSGGIRETTIVCPWRAR